MGASTTATGSGGLGGVMFAGVHCIVGDVAADDRVHLVQLPYSAFVYIADSEVVGTTIHTRKSETVLRNDVRRREQFEQSQVRTELWRQSLR